jgi:hypothetical protein
VTRSDQPKWKAAKNINQGDWCVFGGMAFQAGEPMTNDDGNILISWGNGSVSEFTPDERIPLHYDKEAP